MLTLETALGKTIMAGRGLTASRADRRRTSPRVDLHADDNLWVLGGELIRDLHYDPSLRKLAADRLLRDAVHEDGGPLVHNGSEEEQRSFDSTCRKLHRFLTQPQS